jgi:hypothetical protein
MAFKVNDYTDNTFHLDILGDDGAMIATYELKALTYTEWNEIGLTVVADEAPKIKDPDNPKKLIHDLAGQRLIDAQAEITRNVMRVVVSLEGGEGIEWGGKTPSTLEAKAEILLNIDSSMVWTLLNGIRTRAFGKKVSSEEATARFQRMEAEAITGSSSETDDD